VVRGRRAAEAALMIRRWHARGLFRAGLAAEDSKRIAGNRVGRRTYDDALEEKGAGKRDDKERHRRRTATNSPAAHGAECRAKTMVSSM
jgi:hypothetical protein